MQLHDQHMDGVSLHSHVHGCNTFVIETNRMRLTDISPDGKPQSEPKIRCTTHVVRLAGQYIVLVLYSSGQ